MVIKHLHGTQRWIQQVGVCAQGVFQLNGITALVKCHPYRWGPGEGPGLLKNQREAISGLLSYITTGWYLFLSQHDAKIRWFSEENPISSCNHAFIKWSNGCWAECYARVGRQRLSPLPVLKPLGISRIGDSNSLYFKNNIFRVCKRGVWTGSGKLGGIAVLPGIHFPPTTGDASHHNPGGVSLLLRILLCCGLESCCAVAVSSRNHTAKHDQK